VNVAWVVTRASGLRTYAFSLWRRYALRNQRSTRRQNSSAWTNYRLSFAAIGKSIDVRPYQSIENIDGARQLYRQENPKFKGI
jgi:hypothetical protein